MNRFFALGLLLGLAARGLAQSTPRNPFTSDIRRDYGSVRDYFIRAADKMPEDKYGFRPSPDVRSFAQQVAHVADDQYNLCSAAKGEQRVTFTYTLPAGVDAGGYHLTWLRQPGTPADTLTATIGSHTFDAGAVSGRRFEVSASP